MIGNVERWWQEAQFWASPKYPQKRLVSFCSFEKAKIQNRQISAQMKENVQRLKSFSWWHGQTGAGEGCHCTSKLTPHLVKKVERWSISDTLRLFPTPSCCDYLSLNLEQLWARGDKHSVRQARDEALSRDLCLKPAQPLSTHWLDKDSLAFPGPPFL